MPNPFPGSYTWGNTIGGEAAVVAAQQVAHLPWKKPVRVATTGNITIATDLNDGDTIDGVTLAAGDRVLVWQQTTASQNGIWIVDATPFRAADADSSEEILGSVVLVLAGSTYGGQIFVNTNSTTIVVDTDDITYALLSGGGGSGSAIVDHGNMGATETLDFTDGTWHRGTLNANCTITVTGYTVDQGLVALFKVAQDATGDWDITWDGDVVFIGDEQPDQTANAVTFFLLWSDEGDSVVYASKIGGGGGEDAGHYELLMAAGSSPIEPLETGDGLDWLYVWVPAS